MIATVIKADNGLVDVRVRRNCDIERLDRTHFDLTPGDRIECKRTINNPYVIRVYPTNGQAGLTTAKNLLIRMNEKYPVI